MAKKQNRQKKTVRRFHAILKNGISLYLATEDDDIRIGAADKLLEAVLEAPSVWTKSRFYAFELALDLMRKNQGKYCTKHDIRLLSDRFIYNDLEPANFRVVAVWLVAHVKYLWKRGDVNSAAELIRLGMDIIDKALAVDEDRVVSCQPHFFVEYRLKHPGWKSLLNVQRQCLLGKLKQWEGKFHTDEDKKKVIATHGQFDFEPRRTQNAEEAPLVVRLNAGGAVCDCCGKTTEELRLDSLMRCSRCLMVFYCSEECQKQHWEMGGHKHACRKRGEIKEGDDMMLHASPNRTGKLDGDFVKVVRRVEGERNRWEVKPFGSANLVSVSGNNLVRLRPPSEPSS